MDDLDIKKEQLLSQLSGLPESQVKTLKEKIQSMSPEEFEQFTQKRCIFCDISSGKIESFKIYENEDVLAVLDINPISKGHAIVIPKKHVQFLFQIPDELSEKLLTVVKNLMPVLINITKAQGVNIIINQGLTAGQYVEHFSINLIPRYKDDKLIFDWQRLTLQKSEIEALAKQISERVKIPEKKESEEEKKEAESKKAAEAEEIEKIWNQVRERVP